MICSGFPLTGRNYRDIRDGRVRNVRSARADWKQHRASSNAAALSAPFVPESDNRPISVSERSRLD
jgi:hypothetical protein